MDLNTIRATLKEIRERNTDGGPGSGPPDGNQNAYKGGPDNHYREKLQKEREETKALKKNNKALFLYKQGFMSRADSVDMMRNHPEDLDGKVDEYYDLMEQNGSPESTKPLESNNTSTRNQDVDSGKYESHDEAKIAYVADKTGFGRQQSAEISNQLTTWTSNRWSHADQSELDKYVENDHTYDGEIYRGMHFYESSDYNKFMSGVEAGATIHMNGTSSWSSNKNDADTFAHTSNRDVNSVVIRCLKNRTSSPIAYMNSQGENEVLAHSKAQWTVLSTETYDTGNGAKNTVINVVEKGRYRD